jgi:predicted transcriptional regulator
MTHFQTLREAVAIIEKAVIEKPAGTSLPRSILIFDERYQLLGVVRRRDILRGLEPEFLKSMPLDSRREWFDTEVDPNLLEIQAGKIASGVRKQGDRPVSEIMRPLNARVNYDDHVARIIHEMVTKHENLLPVLRDNKVVGVVRSVDVFHEVARLMI